MTPQGRYDEALIKLKKATTDEDRFYALNDSAKEAFNLGLYPEAEGYAKDLQSLASKFKTNWNYGNAVQDYNIVLGRLALRDGRIDDAKAFLLAAGGSPGSPQMDSFGPNMSLAKDLLAKGEKGTVIQYFDLCRSFWKMDRGRLDQWKREVEAGKTPDFGANLVY